MKLFRDLGPAEERKFRASARKNYKPFSPINGVWHPVYQNECAKINAEAGANLDPRDLEKGLIPEKP